MLKSTYRASVPVPTSSDSPLPPGWTEHKAPTGHTYYYNAETKQSTYTRPADLPSNEPLQIDYGATEPDHVMRASMQAMEQFRQNTTTQPQPGPGHFTGGRSYQEHSRGGRRGNQGDRPKSKAPIPNYTPWVLVKTKLGRRFVHNTETKQSLWKFPQDVMMAVIEMDRMEWEAKKRKEEEEAGKETEDREKSQAQGETERAEPSTAGRPEPVAGHENYDSDSYEEVEVTDDEADEGEEPSKRPRLSHNDDEEPRPAGPVEFNEDDIAWQLAQMEGGYDDYDNPDLDSDVDTRDRDQEEDEEEGLPLTEFDNIALFRSLLDDSAISPYSTFEKLIEDAHLVEDPRYVVLPNASARKEAFSQWSKDRTAELQAMKQAAQQERKPPDARVSYLQFLQRNATPKLYWPEFKRKFKRSPEMVDRNLQDKDREKLYRELVAKLKLSESERRKELVSLLKDTAKKEKSAFSRGMSVEELPDGTLRDVRFHILEEGRREELVRTFLETL